MNKVKLVTDNQPEIPVLDKGILVKMRDENNQRIGIITEKPITGQVISVTFLDNGDRTLLSRSLFDTLLSGAEVSITQE